MVKDYIVNDYGQPMESHNLILCICTFTCTCRYFKISAFQISIKLSFLSSYLFPALP